ncbi:hypothetical protein BJF78_07470 [Pseudonocardia sp. CNS-139]|nr:hypothetical protein BJF78_07470 [Pseudonocardia sp. CNS-139]
MTWENPPAARRQQILRATRTVAVVGASPNPARASNFVATYLLASTGYDVYFVNPNATEILGRPVYPALADLPVVPDLVDVFRRREDLPTVLDDVLASTTGCGCSGCSSGSSTRTWRAAPRPPGWRS